MTISADGASRRVPTSGMNNTSPLPSFVSSYSIRPSLATLHPRFPSLSISSATPSIPQPKHRIAPSLSYNCPQRYPSRLLRSKAASVCLLRLLIGFDPPAKRQGQPQQRLETSPCLQRAFSNSLLDRSHSNISFLLPLVTSRYIIHSSAPVYLFSFVAATALLPCHPLREYHFSKHITKNL